jgi:hypothetical protein
MGRKLFKLAIFLLLVHGFYRFAPLYWNDARMKWDIKEAAHAWRDLSQAEIEDEVLGLAAKYQVPINRRHVAVQSTGARVAVGVSYVIPVQFIPGWRYPWTFDSTIETWTLNRPARTP